ncbi:MAG: hypothetical protein ACYC35_23280 [Pirellulales bacterium]
MDWRSGVRGQEREAPAERVGWVERATGTNAARPDRLYQRAAFGTTTV